MPSTPDKSGRRRYPIKPLAGGLNDARNPVLLQDGETPDCENVDFDRDSIAAHGGALKFNNQVAPHAGLLTRTSFAPLYIETGKSVPQRGYGTIGYDPTLDIGGDFAFDAGGGAAPTDDTFHARRGKSFDFSLSFEMPAEEKLYVGKTGAGATPREDLGGDDAYDEALEEATIIVQKGGDGLAAMSWALALVNTGGMYTRLTGDDTATKVSPWALVFMWLDAPQWGSYGPGQMRYLLGAGGANVGTTGLYSTNAYRAILARAFVEPGRTYHVAVALRLDSGDPGSGADPTAAWNQDGSLEIVLRSDRGTVTRCATSGTDLFPWKGPLDSIAYLTRYGVRFSGRDAVHLGLGFRFAPWSGWGFAPYGLDSAAMEAGGFRMLDVSAQGKPAAYTVSHTCTHTSPNSYVTINLQGMHGGTPADLPNPLDPTDGGATAWGGLYTGAVVPNQGTAGQSEALRNHWLVLWGGTGDGELNGVRLLISHYLESGGTFRFECGLSGTTKDWTNEDFFIIPFRWHQRPLRLSNFKMFDTSTRARVWTDPRTQYSLASHTELDDATEPDLAQLVAYWPMDDAGGAVLRELVAGRSGYLAPYGLGRTAEGGLFLSGEGEALCLDLSENPVLEREIGAMLRSGTQGFAVELHVRLPQAYYAREQVVGTERRGRYAPILAEWAVKDDDAGYATAPAPLLRFGHRARFPTAYGTGPFYFPAGFNLEAAVESDQDGTGLEPVLHAFTAATTSSWSTDAAWVGQSIRLQFGVQSAGSADAYTVYLAASPKSVLNPANGDPPEAEFAYFDSRTIHRRDLARLVVVIGGAWRPEAGWGYLETNARMVVERARVFGVAAPGALPGVSGDVVTGRDGKLGGDKSLPVRDLTPADLLHPLGPARSNVNVTEGSTAVTPADAGRFFEGEPEASLAALKETFLLVGGDELELWEEGTVPTRIEEFYYVSSVAAGGGTATLSRSYNDRTASNVWAAAFRVIGESSFNDDISQKALSIGKGTPFSPSSNPSDAVLTEPYFKNLAPVTGDWRLRVFATAALARDIVPLWSRGLALPRSNPVLGLQSHQGVLYGVTRGCLYEVDDRWRLDGPTEGVTRCLAIRGEALNEHGVVLPLERDGVRWESLPLLRLSAATLGGNPFNLDAWVKLDAWGEVQTLAWCGDPRSNPAALPGTSFVAHLVHWWARFARGYPEMALGSTATYDGTNRPEKGLFVARAATRIPVGVWTHVRWVLPGHTSGTWVGTPLCYVNGRPSAVALHATQNGAGAGQWVQSSTLAGPTSSSDLRLLLGIARDAFAAPEIDGTFADNVLSGRLLQPNRHQGFLHALDGRVAEVVVHNRTVLAFFDPYAIALGTLLFRALSTPEGVGHKVLDSISASYGVIESHPAISLFHEMGLHTKPASWARYGDRIFVTTGGRPVLAAPR